MNVVYIPSTEKKDVAWLDDVVQTLGDVTQDVYAHSYSHWHEETISLDPELELEILGTQVTDIESYTLVTKSLGGLLALRGVYEGTLQPKAVIWMGFPLQHEAIDTQSIQTWLAHTDIPIIIVQHIDDPVGAYDAVSTWVNQHNKKILFAPIPGDSHDYSEFDVLREIMVKLNG